MQQSMADIAYAEVENAVKRLKALEKDVLDLCKIVSAQGKRIELIENTLLELAKIYSQEKM